MSDLIERQNAIDALKKIMFTHLFECGEYIGEDTREVSIMNAEKALDAIENLPSAEPERKIIYCKDCKFAHLTTKGEVKYCDVWFPEEKTYLSADNFCSSAEKRGE